MMRLNNTRLTPLLIGVLLMSGCATNKPLYHWGDYEQLILSSYTKPGEADAATQIQKLTADIQLAESSGQKVAPGVFAQLGLMYAEQGQQLDSIKAFEQEKTQFPESALFIDGLMERAKKAGKN